MLEPFCGVLKSGRGTEPPQLNGARPRAALPPPSCLPGDLFVTTAPTTAIHRLAFGRAIAVTGWEAGWIALMVAVYARIPHIRYQI